MFTIPYKFATSDHTDTDWLRSQEVLQCIRNEFPKVGFTHCVSVNPCITTPDLVAIERMIQCGLSRAVDRLPQTHPARLRFLLLREVNGAQQPHYHGWLAASDCPHLPLEECASRWINRGIVNYVSKHLRLEGGCRPNLEICRIAEHPRGSKSTKKRTADTALGYPLKLRTALAKGEGVIWM
jgi:hypothetical protein